MVAVLYRFAQMIDLPQRHLRPAGLRLIKNLRPQCPRPPDDKPRGEADRDQADDAGGHDEWQGSAGMAWASARRIALHDQNNSTAMIG